MDLTKTKLTSEMSMLPIREKRDFVKVSHTGESSLPKGKPDEL